MVCRRITKGRCTLLLQLYGKKKSFVGNKEAWCERKLILKIGFRSLIGICRSWFCRVAGDSWDLAFVPVFGDYHWFLNHSPITARIQYIAKHSTFIIFTSSLIWKTMYVCFHFFNNEHVYMHTSALITHKKQLIEITHCSGLHANQ